MTTTTILASGTTAANSSDVIVPAGLRVTLALFATTQIPTYLRCQVYMKGPSGAQVVGGIDGYNPAAIVSGPGTFYVSRPDLSEEGFAVGVFSES